MNFRNFKMVGYVVYGRGSFNQLDEIIEPHRKDDNPMIFLVDHFFDGCDQPRLIPPPVEAASIDAEDAKDSTANAPASGSIQEAQSQ